MKSEIAKERIPNLLMGLRPASRDLPGRGRGLVGGATGSSRVEHPGDKSNSCQLLTAPPPGVLETNQNKQR